jgi:hypothetical protein
MATRIEALVEEMDAVRAETLRLVGRVPGESFNERAGGEWSASELFEHILLAEASVGRVLRKVLRETEGELPPYPENDSSLAVGIDPVFEGMESPDVVLPEGGISREGLLAREEDIRSDTRKILLDQVGKIDPAAAHFRHPRFGLLDLYQWPAVVVVAHEKHHQGQLRRILGNAPPA